LAIYDRLTKSGIPAKLGTRIVSRLLLACHP